MNSPVYSAMHISSSRSSSDNSSIPVDGVSCIAIESYEYVSGPRYATSSINQWCERGGDGAPSELMDQSGIIE